MPDCLTRRHFLINGTLVLAGAALGGCATKPEDTQAGRSAKGESIAPALRFGFVTDIHYADKDAAGTRVYRDSLAKMQTAVAALNQTAQQDALGLAFAITLGDLIDSPAAADMTPENIAVEMGYLDAIEAAWSKVTPPRHYVLGNHCVFTLTKEEFFAHTGGKPAPYSFDAPFARGTGAVHFVVLDACFTSSGAPYGRRNANWSDANIPARQVAWLADDLARSKNPVVLLVHQRLDELELPDFQIKNAADVRAVLEKSGRVVAVLQGHSHQNFLGTVRGIPYCVLRAMVEDPGAANNAFGVVEIFPDYSLAVRGSFRQSTYPNLAHPT